MSKYKTEEERLEGRRATLREAYYRKSLKEGKIPKPIKKRIEQKQKEKLEEEKELRDLVLDLKNDIKKDIHEVKELIIAQGKKEQTDKAPTEPPRQALNKNKGKK